MGTMPEATAAMVLRETGVNVSGYTAILPGDSVQHIIKRHGDASTENARGQVAVVQIGAETVGVRIAVRDTMRPAESQIYNWNIKKAALDGEGRLPDGRSSSGVSSAADGTTDAAVAPSIAQPQPEVNPAQDAENNGRLTLPTLEDAPLTQPGTERAAEANTAPGEGNGTQDSGADAKISTPGKTDGPRFSIEMIDGELTTVIDTQNDTREFAATERYLKTLVDAEHPFSTILSDAQPVYLGKDLPGEYKCESALRGQHREHRRELSPRRE